MPKAIAMRKIEGKPGKVYYPLELITIPSPTLSPTQVVVKISAAALNHRDLFLRQHLYPGCDFGIPLLADGCGVVTSTGSDPSAQKWRGKRVIINPGEGWDSDPEGPESPKGYAILGGTNINKNGTLSDEMVIDASHLEPAPDHLSSIEAAAIPLTGLTAWRAVMTKSGQAKPGRNLLVTGIGGGVAIMALLFGVAAGANVYVTSGSQEKIERAIKLGAKGGVSYKEKDWDKKLLAKLDKSRPKFDAVIDGAGGDIIERGPRLLKPGGSIVVYGMTVSPKMTYNMSAVLRNLDVRGSTMGSRKEFADMVKFVSEKNLRPVISRSVFGLDNIEGLDSLFEDMKSGSQFGKLVVELVKDDSQAKSKL